MDQSPNNIIHLELFISCRDLRKQSHLYLPDPSVQIYRLRGKSDLQYLGSTEMLKHNINPDFKTTIKLEYDFTHRYQLVIKVVNANQNILGKVYNDIVSLSESDEVLGQCQIDLTQIIGAKDNLIKVDLTYKKEKHGKLYIFADRLSQHEQETQIKWQWSGIKLKDTLWIGKGDPFAKFYRYSDTRRLLIYQTEVIKNNQNPNWKEWTTSAQKLCPEKEDFNVEIYDYKHIGSHNFVGSCDINIKSVTESNMTKFHLQTEKKKDAGYLEVKNVVVSIPPPIEKKEPSQFDYLKGSWQLQLVIGLDFTFSNGPITKEDSLHYISSDSHNNYQTIMEYVGNTIVGYDFEKKIPIFGFGGVPKLPNYTKPYVEHCFPLNGNEENPFCNDIQGVLDVYAQAVPNIEFSGPTFAAEILNKAYEFVRQKEKQEIYTIVLAITDGQIEDMDDCMKLLAKCSQYPMSIVIVGVGDENFESMKKLENQDVIRQAVDEFEQDKVRDIIQFIAYKDVDNEIEQLTEKVLKGCGKQFMDYMKLHNKVPKENSNKVELSSIE